MHGSWCWSFLAGHLAANSWTPFSRLFAAIGGKHISAGVTSCSCAANATAKRVSFMLGTGTPAYGFSPAANALTSLISPQWAIGGTVRRVASRSYALGSNGAGTVPCRSNREVCMSGHTSVFWECLPITRPCESRGRVMLESTNHASIVSIYGGNAETDSLASVVGQFVDDAS
jgi:hypothetical protein